MRVLYPTHNYPRFAGDPSGAFIEELLRALPEDEIEPYVLCPHTKGLSYEEQRGGVKIYRFRYATDKDETLAYEGKMLAVFKRGVKGLRLLTSFLNAFVREMRIIIEEKKIDLIHAHWLLPAGVAARAALSGSQLPFLLSVHGTDVRLLEKLPFGNSLARRVLKRVQLTLPVSSYLDDKLAKLGGRLLPRTVLSMPASGIFLAPPRKRLIPSVAAVGNLTHQKRFDLLIKALGILHRKGYHFELILVGEGPERKKLEELAKREGIAERVEFLGKLPHYRLPEVLKRAGVMVLPSVGEGFGLALVEAQLAGLAVVGTDAGGQREIIQHQKTGILTKPDDPAALAQAIKELYSNKEKTLKMAFKGQQSAKERFLAVPAALRLLNIYKRILG
jgi:glycosyltransferase involved in cell wall biosynthesis